MSEIARTRSYQRRLFPPDVPPVKTFPLLNEFVAFVTERWNIHLRRQAGEPAPWTTDLILQKYRFCNMRREDDRVTRWVHEYWLRPHASDTDLWFAMYVARVFNNPTTLEAICYPVPWNQGVKRRITKVRDTGARMYSAAYIVSTMGRSMDKTDFYLELFDRLWAARKELRPGKGDTLAEFCSRLVKQKDVGTFMAAQVVADVKWADRSPLRDASDWRIFAASGPGSRRGLNRVCGRPVEQPWQERAWYETLLELRERVLPRLPKKLKTLDAANLQNALCEADKYLRAKFDEGRPKQNFEPAKKPYGE